MSLDDSTAPETMPETPNGSARADRPTRTYLLVGLALALVVGLVGFFTMRGASGEPKGADCVSEVVTLTTAPVMEDLPWLVILISREHTVKLSRYFTG